MLKEKIQKDYLVAFKKKDQIATETLSMLKAAIQYAEVEARSKDASLTDADIIKIIQSEAKKRKEAVDSFSLGGKLEAAQKEEEQLLLLKQYLPKPMDEGELRKKISGLIEQMGAQGMKDFGKVMKSASMELKGKAEGSAIKAIVEEMLGN